MNNSFNSSTPQGLLRFMLYTDVNRRRATQVGPDRWVDLQTVFSDTYDYGSKHQLQFDELGHEPGQFVVAMISCIRQVAHPDQTGQTVPLRLVYLTSAALWPFFEPFTPQTLNSAILPG